MIIGMQSRNPYKTKLINLSPSIIRLLCGLFVLKDLDTTHFIGSLTALSQYLVSPKLKSLEL